MPIRGSPNGGPLNPVHAFPQAIPWWTSSLGIGGRHQSVRVDVINRFCWSPSLGTPTSEGRSVPLGTHFQWVNRRRSSLLGCLVFGHFLGSRRFVLLERERQLIIAVDAERGSRETLGCALLLQLRMDFSLFRWL